MGAIKKIFGYCPTCERWFRYPKRRRMSSSYIDEESNYCCECKECFARTEEYWDSMREELY